MDAICFRFVNKLSCLNELNCSMSRKPFWYIHDLIKRDPIFQSTGTRPQRPVKYQLATFLCRVGSESAVKTAWVMSIAEGTVYLYSRRVCQAVRRIAAPVLLPVPLVFFFFPGPASLMFSFPPACGFDFSAVFPSDTASDGAGMA